MHSEESSPPPLSLSFPSSPPLPLIIPTIAWMRGWQLGIAVHLKHLKIFGDGNQISCHLKETRKSNNEESRNFRAYISHLSTFTWLSISPPTAARFCISLLSNGHELTSFTPNLLVTFVQNKFSQNDWNMGKINDEMQRTFYGLQILDLLEGECEKEGMQRQRWCAHLYLGA